MDNKIYVLALVAIVVGGLYVLNFTGPTGAITAAQFSDLNEETCSGTMFFGSGIPSVDFSFSDYSHAVGKSSSNPGKLSLNEFNVVMSFDKSTPKLYQALSTGGKIPTVTIGPCIQSSGGKGGENVKYYVYTLKNALITSIAAGGKGDNAPSESVSFNYEKIIWSYNEVDDRGKATGLEEKIGWDCIDPSSGEINLEKCKQFCQTPPIVPSDPDIDNCLIF